SFSLRDGQVRLEDAKRRMVLDAEFTTQESVNRRDPGRFELKGEGRLNNRRFSVDLAGAPLINVRRDRPYGFVADVRLGARHVELDGKINRPFDLAGFAADVEATGNALADLYYLLGLTLPNTPPYSLSGQVVRNGDVYGMPRVAGRVGDSDLSGHFTATRR